MLHMDYFIFYFSRKTFTIDSTSKIL